MCLPACSHNCSNLIADSFDTANSNFPFPSPTPPAPGPSLLDDNESKFLDSFFDGVSSDQFNYDFFNNAPEGSELGLGWDELPPTFMGTTSSFGQQPQIGSNGLPDLNFNDMNTQMNAAPSIPPSTSADVLAAATLLQNGSNGRSHSMGDGRLFRSQDMAVPPTNGQLRQQSMSQYTPSRSNTAIQERPATADFMRDTFYTDMMFGSQPDGLMRPRPTVNQKIDVRWGSDSGFHTGQNFVAPVSQEKILALEHSHVRVVESAFIETMPGTSSAESTRPSSPVPRHAASHQRTKSLDNDLDTRPRKRRKSKFRDDDDDDDESPASASKQSSKKRKSIKKSSSNDSPGPDSEQSHKRRKSTAAANAAAKASRENLTEDQKRENHIKSEQKRRTLIREGFEDLGELVPGLRGGGFSKSAVLIMAADWLEELIQGNEALRRRLDSMQGRA